MEMPVTEELLFNLVPEIKDNKLGLVKRKDVINNLENKEKVFFLVLPSSSP
jgi:hypothetical protein